MVKSFRTARHNPFTKEGVQQVAVFDGFGHCYDTGEHVEDLRKEIGDDKHLNWSREDLVSLLLGLQNAAKAAPPGAYRAEVESVERCLKDKDRGGSPFRW